MEDPEQVSTQTDFVMNMQEQYEEEDENEEYELDSEYESDEEEDLRDDDDCIGWKLIASIQGVVPPEEEQLKATGVLRAAPLTHSSTSLQPLVQEAETPATGGQPTAEAHSDTVDRGVRVLDVDEMKGLLGKRRSKAYVPTVVDSFCGAGIGTAPWRDRGYLR